MKMNFMDLYGDPYHGYEIYGQVAGCRHLVVYNPQSGELEAIELVGFECVQIPVSAVPSSDIVEKINLSY